MKRAIRFVAVGLMLFLELVSLFTLTVVGFAFWGPIAMLDWIADRCNE